MHMASFFGKFFILPPKILDTPLKYVYCFIITWPSFSDIYTDKAHDFFLPVIIVQNVRLFSCHI